MKYSSGKKELCAIWSSGISPLKRSLRACQEGRRHMKVLGREPRALPLPLIAFLRSPRRWLLSYRLHHWVGGAPQRFCSLPVTFLALPAPILATGNLRKNQAIPPEVRGKPATLLCSLNYLRGYKHLTHSVFQAKPPQIMTHAHFVL